VTDQERASDDLDVLYDLAAEVIDGTASGTQIERLEELLHADPNARSAYLRCALLHAQLNLTDVALIARAAVRDPEGFLAQGSEPPSAGRSADGVRPPLMTRLASIRGLVLGVGRTERGRSWIVAAAAACLVALFAGGLVQLRRPAVIPIPQRPGPPPIARQEQGKPRRVDGAVATVVEARQVAWADEQAPIGNGTRLQPQQIRWDEGTLKLAFDSGAFVTVVGPADVRVLSDMRIRTTRGRITARMEGRAKGFSIETPSTVVVDRGTEFGLEVDTSGQTGVVVFEGLVDLSLPGSAQVSASIKRLGQGEGMRIGRTGRISRIVSVERRPDLDAWSIGPSTDQDVVIRSVRDNIRELGSSKYYSLVHRGLADGSPAYVDRLFQWRGLASGGLPEFLRGADYIMTFNDDKRTKDLQITVELGPPASLYVFYDNRQAIQPWLAEQFSDTGVDIGLDVTAAPNWDSKTPPYPFSIWKRDMARGESISLGANEIGATLSMYGIAALRRP
jgi:hypothetical protein